MAIDLRVTIDPMNARIIIAAVGALIIAGTLTECLDQDEHNIARCLRARGWDEQKTLTKRARVSCLFLFHLHRNFHVMVKSGLKVGFEFVVNENHASNSDSELLQVGAQETSTIPSNSNGTSGIVPGTSDGTSGIVPGTSNGTSGIVLDTSDGNSGIVPGNSNGSSGIVPNVSNGTSGIVPSTSNGTYGIVLSTSNGNSGIVPHSLADNPGISAL